MNSTTEILPYKLAKKYIGPNESFVYYWYYSLSEQIYKRDKVKLGLWNVPAAKLEDLLDELCKKVNKVLKHRNKNFIYHEEVVKTNIKFDHSLLVPEALRFVMKSDKKISDDRKGDLSDTALNFQAFIDDHSNFSTLRWTGLNHDIIDLFAKWCKEKLGRAGKTINKYLAALQFTSEWLKKKGYLFQEFDTSEQRVNAPKNETEKYPPLTHEEKVRAFEYFRAYYPEYYLYLLFIYYTCIRPKELHRLTVNNLNLIQKTTHVPWYKSKNGLSAYVQIFIPLHDALMEHKADRLNRNWYLFSNRCIPGPDLYQGDYSSKHWYRHREKMDMPIEKSAYGLKHTFNIDYVENNKYNIDWEFLRRHNRHATIQQTQQYISTLTAYFLDETRHIIQDYHNIKPSNGASNIIL